jgi:hypothetical protein
MAATLGAQGLIAKLDPSYYADPTKLWNAAFSAPPGALALSGHQLSIRVPAPWVGTFTIEVTASDGGHSVKRSFNVTVTSPNAAPVLAPIANQTLSHSQRTLTLTLSATDADNDPITYYAQVLPINGQTPNVSVTVTGNQLTIRPAIYVVGTFSIRVIASDGKTTNAKTFSVTINNSAPVIGSIATQRMLAGQASVTFAVPVSDADGDALTYQAVAQVPDAAAYQLDRTYDFRPTSATYYYNLLGQSEKWLIDKSNRWYLIMPTGKVYRWAQTLSATLTATNQIAALDPKVYTEPRLLWDAKPPIAPALTFSFQGNQLTIQRPAGLTGVYFIDVIVSDGAAAAKRTVQIILN